MSRGRGRYFEANMGAQAVAATVLLLFLWGSSFGADIEKELQNRLQRSREQVTAAEGKIASGRDASSEINALMALTLDIRELHEQISELFLERAEELKAGGPGAAERHRSMQEGYQKAIGEYLNLISGLESSALSLHTEKTIQMLQALKTLLDRMLPKRKRPLLGSLPYKTLNYPPNLPYAGPLIQPAYVTGSAVKEEDTMETPEAPLTYEIASLAESLKWHPVKIYEYVMNNVETQWYWGCMKGAEETLRQKAGNDCDQASLFVALLRASGYPARYVRGTVQFFAGGRKKDIDKVKNLFGMEDPKDIGVFLQKAGIPFKPVISGGGISNYQIEHIWVETQVPYGNYRGAIIDNSDKRWLGLDTSVKIKWYQYNSHEDALTYLEPVRDEYLASATTQTPLEYIKEKIPDYQNYVSTRSIPPFKLGILPDSMQFDKTYVTHEYTEIPEELKYKVRITASTPYKAEPLFDITFDTHELSNRQVILASEPETVEDQEIIDSYGGLDNTPAYMVRLRPILKIDEEMVIAAKDGLSMGDDFELAIELISPNGTERSITTHSTGNVSAIGIVAGSVTPSGSPLPQGGENSAPSPLGGEGWGEGNAEAILHKEALRYIDRWNKSEEELASLLHLRITRPIPSVVTVGNMLDVTYLLDTPHAIEWKGVYIDANIRAVSLTPSGSPLPQGGGAIVPTLGKGGEGGFSGERQKTFMQLSALEGSVLEHRIFEDDFQVDSISTAKLFQAVGAIHESPIIDKTNIASILTGLDLDDNIKEDITNAVNQGYVVHLPSDGSQPLTSVSYKDWSGIGYIKENPETGEAGYMLSGMIAGGMTAINKDKWINEDLKNKLGSPSTKKVNKDPNAVTQIFRIRNSDYQKGLVGAAFDKPLQVIALDKEQRPVQGVSVTFKIVSGGGGIKESSGGSTYQKALTILSNARGIAQVWLKAGDITADYPIFRQVACLDSKKCWELDGLNQVTATATHPAKGIISVDKPFEAYGRPDKADSIKRISPKTAIVGVPNVYAGETVWVKIVDRFGNSISGKPVSISSKTVGTLPQGGVNGKFFKTPADCPGGFILSCPVAKEYTASKPLEINTEHFGAQAHFILGNTQSIDYTVTVKAKKDTVSASGARRESTVTLGTEDFIFYTKMLGSVYSFLGVYEMYSTDDENNMINAGKINSVFNPNNPLKIAMYYSEQDTEVVSCGQDCYRLDNKGTFRTYPVTKTVSKGAPAFTDAKVEFRYPDTVQVDPAIQTSETNGFYPTKIAFGSKPGKNIFRAAGYVTAEVPVVDQKTGAIYLEKRDFTELTEFYLWALNIKVPSGIQIKKNAEGYLSEDLLFDYKIEPNDYPYVSSSLRLEVFESSGC